MPNPFFYGGRVNPEQFVGRRAELQRIFAGLEVAHTGQLQSFSVVGPRRIGKSALLFYITNKFAAYLMQPALYRIGYIELQDANCRTLGGMLEIILKQLGVGQLSGKKTPLVEFQDAIIELKARGVFPVVCLDEFEELTAHPDQFKPDLYDSWRYLINQEAITFITASKSPLIDLAQDRGPTSPFFNVFSHLPLGELTDDEARELIARGAECDRPFTSTEQSDALLLADKHPYKLQLVSSLLYQAKADNRVVDWAELRREFVTQLQSVGLEADMGRTLKQVGRPTKEGEPTESVTRRARFRTFSSVFAFALYALAIALMIYSRNAPNEQQWVVIIAAVFVLVGIVLTLISFGVIPINDSERTV
ncbi:MAG: ATP-binding protein [Chloroflexi bacterium]|nr:ATP-binding protein [Chloroflexota bacterium]